MSEAQTTAAQPVPPVKPAQKQSVLLVDADPDRQLIRATAMRERGVIVDAVHTGSEARGLWKPRFYRLLIIELSGASPDTDDFYRYVLDREPNQRFAFYSNVPPYLTSTPPRQRVADDAPEGRALRGPKPPAEAAPASEPARNASKSPIYARQDRPTRQSKVSSSFAESVKNAERDLLERS
jgi:hypothetical protein